MHLGWWTLASFWFGNAGAVRLANWLRGQPEWRGALFVVDGDATTIGGCFYSRPTQDAVRELPRGELAAANGVDVPFVVALREPLSPSQLAELGGFELAASFAGMLDLRRGERRFVYRRR